jgi:hypothetical protein
MNSYRDLMLDLKMPVREPLFDRPTPQRKTFRKGAGIFRPVDDDLSSPRIGRSRTPGGVFLQSYTNRILLGPDVFTVP